MSKFFTYEERLILQKYLKESLSFKEIGRRLGKNPTTISREVRKYLSEVATGHPGFPYNACRSLFNCRKKRSAARNAQGRQHPIVSYAQSVMTAVWILLRKSVRQDPAYLMSAMAVSRLANVPY